jgi:hypothetical protein
MATVRTWIISVHNSEECGAKMFRKFGDEYDIKKQLVKMVKEAGKDHEDTFDKYSSTVHEADFEEDMDDYIVAVAQFENFHIDFTAIPLDYINDVDTE